MDGDGRCSEAHFSHTHLHLGFGSDSGGAEEEMDGWVLSRYCTPHTVQWVMLPLYEHTIYSPF